MQGIVVAFFSWMVGVATDTLGHFTKWFVDLQAQYPQLLSLQTLFGAIGVGLAIWKWYETREARLFRKFESMIARNEAQLVRARTDLLDVMNRPGPGLIIHAPIFVEKRLRAVLRRRKWYPASLWPIGQTVDRRLSSALRTCDRKVAAHLDRLSLFREQVASARLIQGALAAGRAATTREEHERQLLDQEGLDHFRAVLAIPGHQEDLGALELIAHQTARMDRRSQQAVTAYNNLIAALQVRPESPFRNLLLARAKRSLAVLRYPTAGGIAQTLLTEAIRLLTQFGPPRDRDFLELAETCHLDGIARLRLEHVDKGPEQLGLAQGHYRDLIRSLDRRRPSLFKWMLGNRRYSGHRVSELRARAAKGLAEVDRLIKLNDKDQSLLIASLRTGRGVPSHNCMPPH